MVCLEAKRRCPKIMLRAFNMDRDTKQKRGATSQTVAESSSTPLLTYHSACVNNPEEAIGCRFVFIARGLETTIKSPFLLKIILFLTAVWGAIL